MKEVLINFLIASYGATGIIGLIAYWPTIKDLYYSNKPSANISSYVLWTSSGGIGFLYSIFIVPDLLLRIAFGLNFVACLTVLLLSIGLRDRRKRQK